ncbi:hypothetical protein KDD17_13380 [Sulfitobacter albidus]|uniref:Uncharacterized protein n=1 Tax=Sulfitobacter albidus TaxID=2829501 RepID=A0A975JCI1_9RHOB|nr:hypothetical protein [Sulfitobacter albidus]QUJ75913.1 hypothetical protein KDD17_13380 [Sulfitobacter albidus]
MYLEFDEPCRARPTVHYASLRNAMFRSTKNYSLKYAQKNIFVKKYDYSFNSKTTFFMSRDMKRILLLGDRVTDEFILPMLPKGGYAIAADGVMPVKHDWENRDRWCRFAQPGGVAMAASMLREHGLDVVEPTTDGAPQLTAYAVLGVCEPLKDHPDKFAFKRQRARDDFSDYKFRIEKLNGYEKTDCDTGTLKLTDADVSDIALVAINDAGNELRDTGFASAKTLEMALAASNQRVLKMHLPLANGQVWNAFSDQDRKGILLVHAEDLRLSGVKLTRGLSWDTIAEDLHRAASDPSGILHDLVQGSDRLVIFFADEGAAVLHRAEGSDIPDISLIFDGARIEGEIARQLPGTLVGAFNSFFSRLIAELTRETPLNHAVGWALRNAITFQSGFATADRVDGAPAWRINSPAATPLGAPDAHGFIIRDRIGSTAGSLLDGISSPLLQIAHDIVCKGAKNALKAHEVPHATFGKLTTISRNEIEGLRAVRHLFDGYLDDPSRSKPISIAVFGPPGSGKSFGVKQLVDEKTTPILEFNLSEASEADLPAFFHLIRDETLRGRTPLCFFDEFDSNRLTLLKSFLAPMQDGTFRDGHTVHPTGRGLFVFAGGTAETYGEFADIGVNGTFDAHAREIKKPDFLSRLSGYIDVKGPNPAQKGGSDHAYILRRAILLRVMLQQAFPSSVDAQDLLTIQQQLLDHLLTGVDRYLHGARSIETTIRMMSAHKGTLSPGLSDLTSQDQSKLHIWS